MSFQQDYNRCEESPSKQQPSAEEILAPYLAAGWERRIYQPRSCSTCEKKKYESESDNDYDYNDLENIVCVSANQSSDSDIDSDNWSTFDGRRQGTKYLFRKQKQEEETRIVEARQTSVKDCFEKAITYFECNTVHLNTCHVRYYSCLKEALEYSISGKRNGVVVMARDRPVMRKDSLGYVKQYMVGSLHGFFRYASTVSNDSVGVSLDEVIRGENAVRMYFDIEIKVLSPSWKKGIMTDSLTILKSHCEKMEIEVGESMLDSICKEFDLVSVTKLTEAECQSGVAVISMFFSEYIPMLVGLDQVELLWLTGCREEKFSLHIICKNLHVDGSYLSGSLLAFELARRFLNWNLKILISNPDENKLNTMTRKFRIRALMLNRWIKEIEIVRSGTEMIEKCIFFGSNDTPIDEAVYSKNHLFRMAGAVKAGGVSPALVPLREGVQVMCLEKNFARIFQATDEGYNEWLKYLLNCPIIGSLQRPAAVVGWEPSDAYPSRVTWYSHKHRNPRLDVDLDAHFECIRGGCVGGPYVEPRHSLTEQRKINQTERSYSIRSVPGAVPKQTINADDNFTAEDGSVKAFKFFTTNDFIRHNHGQGVEENPSAKVFPGGFHCFVCQTSYGVLQEDTREEPFKCQNQKVWSTDNPLAQIPIEGLDDSWSENGFSWKEACSKKYFVIEGPMGSGKTEQLAEFMSTIVIQRKLSVLIVTFRQFLAIQQSLRLGTACYLDCDRRNFDDCPTFLTICLNSLYKLGGREYDVIIFDEAALTRRHFVSSTVTNVLSMVYDKFCSLVRSAEFVVILQDHLSQEDVQFFTEIDGVQSEDTSKISAYKVVKPCKIHPIQYTTECFQVFDKMIECYVNSFVFDEQSNSYHCRQPFIVFVSQCNFAEYIVEHLRFVATSVDGADGERVRGIWASLKNKNDPFCQRFVMDAGEAAKECDVLVCTSVVGAGFSIDHHFPSFFAFLFNNILEHREEQQFIQRLRIKLNTDLEPNVSRDSYMYVEKGNCNNAKIHTNVARDDLNSVRQMLVSCGGDGSNINRVQVLEDTHSRVVVERALTMARHDALWIEWGKQIQSEFDPFPPATTDEIKTWNTMKIKFVERNSLKRTDVANLVRSGIDIGDLGMGEILSLIELEEGLKVFRVLTADVQLKTMESAFHNTSLAKALIQIKFPADSPEMKKKQDAVLGGASQLSKITISCARMSMYLAWVYQSLDTETTGSFFRHMKTKQYDTPVLKTFSHFQLCKYVLQPLLSSTMDPRPPYLLTPGSTPFFHGLEIITHRSIGTKLMEILESRPDYPDWRTNHCKQIREWVRTFCAEFNARDSYIVALYTKPKTAMNFIRKALRFVGIQLRCTKKRIKCDEEILYKHEAFTPPIDFALMLACKFCHDNVIRILSTIRYSDNLSVADKAWLDEGLELYNKAAEDVNEPQIALFGPDGITGFTVIQARQQEIISERAQRGFEYEEPMDGRAEATYRRFRQEIDIANELVNRNEENWERQKFTQLRSPLTQSELTNEDAQLDDFESVPSYVLSSTPNVGTACSDDVSNKELTNDSGYTTISLLANEPEYVFSEDEYFPRQSNVDVLCVPSYNPPNTPSIGLNVSSNCGGTETTSSIEDEPTYDFSDYRSSPRYLDNLQPINQLYPVVTTGFPNIGNSCYLGSTLQFILAIIPNLNAIEETIENPTPVGNLLHQLFQNVRDTNTLPSILIKLVPALLFGNGRQEDSHECFTRIFDHVEATLAPILGVHNLETYKCRKCKFQLKKKAEDAYHSFLILHLPFNGLRISFSRLIQEFTLEELMPEYKCDNCSSRDTTTRRSILVKPRMHIGIQLKRFFHDSPIKIQTIVEDCFYLDIGHDKFRLVAVICHIGTTKDNGHYVALRLIGDVWYIFDDDKVQIGLCPQSYIEENAYMLLYQKIEVTTTPSMGLNESSYCGVTKPLSSIDDEQTYEFSDHRSSPRCLDYGQPIIPLYPVVTPCFPNIGNSSYLGSALQFILAINPNLNAIEETIDNPPSVGTLLHKLFQNVCDTNTMSYILKKLVLDLQFGIGIQEDSHECFRRIFDHVAANLAPILGVHNVITYQCRRCKFQSKQIKKDTYHSILNLHLPYDGPTISLSRLFQQCTSDEVMHGYKCDDCSSSGTTARRTILVQPRMYIGIKLKRFNADSPVKIKTIVKDCFTLDIGDEMFRLVAAICHIGTTRVNGRYVALRLIDSIWYNFDDDKVQNLLDPRSYIELHAYMLLYQKKNELTILSYKMENNTSKLPNVPHDVRKNYQTLNEQQWLTDDIIDRYIDLLQVYTNHRCRGHTIHFHRCSLYTKYTFDPDDRFRVVSRYVKYKFFQMERVAFPINLHGNHWILAMVDVRENEIHVFDSMRGTHDIVFKNIRQILSDLYHLYEEGAVLDLSEWKNVGHPELPKQDNGNDCGVFTLWYANCVAKGVEIICKQDDVMEIRKKILCSMHTGRIDDYNSRPTKDSTADRPRISYHGTRMNRHSRAEIPNCVYCGKRASKEYHCNICLYYVHYHCAHEQTGHGQVSIFQCFTCFHNT